MDNVGLFYFLRIHKLPSGRKRIDAMKYSHQIVGWWNYWIFDYEVKERGRRQ